MPRLTVALALAQRLQKEATGAGVLKALRALTKLPKAYLATGIDPKVGSPLQKKLVNYLVPVAAGAGISEAGIHLGQERYREGRLEEQTKQLREQLRLLPIWQHPQDPGRFAAGTKLMGTLEPELARRTAAYRQMPAGGMFSWRNLVAKGMSEQEAKRRALSDMQQWVTHQTEQVKVSPTVIAENARHWDPDISAADLQVKLDVAKQKRHRDVLKLELERLRTNLDEKAWKNRPIGAIPENLDAGTRFLSHLGTAAALSPRYWTIGTSGASQSALMRNFPLAVMSTRLGAPFGLAGTPVVIPRVTRTLRNIEALTEQARESSGAMGTAAEQIGGVASTLQGVAPALRQLATKGLGAKVEVNLVPQGAKDWLGRWKPALVVGGGLGVAGGGYLLFQAARARAKQRKAEMKALQEETKLRKLQQKALKEEAAPSAAAMVG